MESSTTAAGQASAAGNGRFATPPPGTRSAAEIRRDIEAQRGELARSVDALRIRWGEVTDLGAQIRKHKGELLVGAAIAGFIIGGAIALRRRD